MLEFYNTNQHMSDVGGLDILKHWIDLRQSAFSDKAKKFKLPSPRGILLLGVQGCGKSLCAKAVASRWQLPLLKLDMGKIFSSLVGSSEENIRRATMVAEAVAPSILWIDEIDKGFSGMTNGFSDAGTSSRVFGTFLTWMQEKEAPVFVIATANNIDNLPPELLRKGRFDEIFFVDLPNSQEREDILKIHLQKRELDLSKFNLNSLAELCVDYSGAEIEQAVISSMYEAYYREEFASQADLEKTIKTTIPLSKTMKEMIEALRGWAQNRAVWASPTEAELRRETEIKTGIEVTSLSSKRKLEF